MGKDKVINGVKDHLNEYSSFLNKLLKRFLKNPISPDLEKRILSAVILVPVAVYAIAFSLSLFLLITIILVVLMTSEWIEITKTATNKKKWHLIGIAYITIPIFCVLTIRMFDPEVLLWMFCVIWATDIFAFFAGRTFGGPKMAPSISPNKTWTGLVGGILASMIIGFLSSFIFSGTIAFFVLVSAFLTIIEQLGDLTESKIKRLFNVKDSGSIIPGHGGVLDRLDGLLFVAPFIFFLILFFPNNFL